MKNGRTSRAPIIGGLLVFVSLLVACGNSYQPVYRPASYGENGLCYYVNDPAEAIALQQQGLCQSGWRPAPMPVVWRNRYAVYYDSPAYYTVYVPAQSRTTYVQVVHTYEQQNQQAIQQAQTQAQWTDQKGKPVSGAAVATQEVKGKASFGGGDVRSKGFSTAPTPAPSAKQPTAAAYPTTTTAPTSTKQPPLATSRPAPTRAPAPTSKAAAPAQQKQTGGFSGGTGRKP